jgi:hypothetical protein
VINIDLGLSCGVAQVGLCGDSNLRGAVVALSKACSLHKGNTRRKGETEGLSEQEDWETV